MEAPGAAAGEDAGPRRVAPVDDLTLAVEAARAGAAVVRAGFGRPLASTLKGEVDPVTEIDRAAEEAILGTILRQRPDDGTLAEESGGEGWREGRRWVVDPLDGTINYLHGIPHIAVSVALYQEGVGQVGVVVDVMRGDVYSAALGRGAFCNGEPLSVSAVADGDQALIATGFPYDRRRHASHYATTLAAVLSRFQGVRRMGTAALDLAWVAAGKYDGYWEFLLGPWDMAAGLLLVTEAGGAVSDHHGAPVALDSTGVVASNGKMQRPLLEAVRSCLPPHLG